MLSAYNETLLNALRERLAVVADHDLRDSDAAAHLQKLREASARLSECVAQLPRDSDPMLRHYLEKQSFTKAVDFLTALS